MINLLLAFLASFTLGLILMPLIIRFFKRKQVGQTILGYVENHKEKNGTLTMGGVVFMITTLLLSFFFLKFNQTWFIVLLVSVFYGILGLMDDYLKIKFKQNGRENLLIKQIFGTSKFNHLVLKKDDGEFIYEATLNTDVEYRSELLNEIMNDNDFIISIERIDND